MLLLRRARVTSAAALSAAALAVSPALPAHAASAGLDTSALALSPVLPAQAASSPGWRIVFSHHFGTAANYSLFFAVAPVGQRQAWAVGGSGLQSPGAGAPIAYRWQNGSWHGSALPAGLTTAVNAVSTPSASDVWTVSDRGGYILHFNGTRWSEASKRFTGFGELTGVTAFSPSDVWVFGGPGAFPGFGSWRYNGQSWTQATTATKLGIITASALSASNMWALGSVNSGGDSIFHYTGAWAQSTGSALSGLQFRAILAEAAHNVWAFGSIQTSGLRPILVHLTSSGWSRIKVPWPVAPTGLAPDGHGGLWLAGQDSSSASWVIHRTTAGQWSRQLIGTSPGLFGLASIPGTASLWGAGSVRTTTGATATIWADGPVS